MRFFYTWDDNRISQSLTALWRNSKLIDSFTTFYTYDTNGLLTSLEIGSDINNIYQTTSFTYEFLSYNPIVLKKSTFRNTSFAPKGNKLTTVLFEFNSDHQIVKKHIEFPSEKIYRYRYSTD